MTDMGRYHRVVAWTDGSDKAAHTADWAAWHAAARGLPLHVLYIPRRAALAGISHGGSFAADDQRTSDSTRVADDVRRLRAEYQDLPVSEQVVRNGRHWPAPGLLDPDDILVTWPSGFLELIEQDEVDERAAARVPAPTVFVPDGVVAGASGQRVLLLTGPRFFPAAARFAFAAAADLGVAMDVLRLPGVYDDDYAMDPRRGPYAVGPHLRAELANLRGRFLGVPGDSYTLGVRPWSVLRAMARGAHLAVLGVGAGCGVDVRAVYDLDICPVAIVPEPIQRIGVPDSRRRPVNG